VKSVTNLTELGLVHLLVGLKDVLRIFLVRVRYDYGRTIGQLMEIESEVCLLVDLDVCHYSSKTEVPYQMNTSMAPRAFRVNSP
jgi:hypothetical protein